MALIYLVVPLSTVGGKPVVPGATKVSYQMHNYWTAYSISPNGAGQTNAIIFRDELSGKYLVGANPTFMAGLPNPKPTLQATVNINPSNWGTWKCDGYTGGSPFINKIEKTLSMRKNVDAEDPVIVGGDSIIGGQAGVQYSLGEYEAGYATSQTSWYGDHV